MYEPPADIRRGFPANTGKVLVLKSKERLRRKPPSEATLAMNIGRVPPLNAARFSCKVAVDQRPALFRSAMVCMAAIDSALSMAGVLSSLRMRPPALWIRLWAGQSELVPTPMIGAFVTAWTFGPNSANDAQSLKIAAGSTPAFLRMSLL